MNGAWRWTVARLIAWADERFHGRGVRPPTWLCLAADVTYGWGPDASDWPTAANGFHRWLHGFLFGGAS